MAKFVLEHSRTVSETHRTRLELLSDEPLIVPVAQRVAPPDPPTGMRLRRVIAPDTTVDEPEDI